MTGTLRGVSNKHGLLSFFSLFLQKCSEKMLTKFITFIKRWLCFISITVFWEFPRNKIIS